MNQRVETDDTALFDSVFRTAGYWVWGRLPPHERAALKSRLEALAAMGEECSLDALRGVALPGLVAVRAHWPEFAARLAALSPEREDQRLALNLFVAWIEGSPDGMSLCRDLAGLMGFDLRLVEGDWRVLDRASQ
jgi:hypothetical protein